MAATAALEAAGRGLDSEAAIKVMTSLKTHNASLQAQLQELQVNVLCVVVVCVLLWCVL